MIATIQTEILSRLNGVSALKTVDVWVADPEEVMFKAAVLPAAYCLYQGMKVQPNQVIGGAYGEARLSWSVILAAKNLKDMADGAETCWDIIESIRTALMGHVVTGTGRLWPDRETLIAANKGLLVYALDYYMDAELP